MKWWWRAKIHPTWQLTAALIGIVIGLGLSAASWTVIFDSLSWVIIGIIVLSFCLFRPYRVLIVAALLSGMLIGLGRGAGDVGKNAIYQQMYGQNIELSGTVSEDPDINRDSDSLLRLVDIQLAGQGLPGKVFVTLAGRNTLQRSDRVTVRGVVQTGFGSFNATMYRPELLRDQRPEPGDVALRARDDFADHVRKGIDEPAASLGLGYLLGQRRALPADLDTALKIAGLTHVVVASGYNLTILIRLIKRLFEKVSRYLTVFMSVLLVLGFIAVTGLSPSMWRAGFVTLACLAAWYFGRKFHPVTLLALAAALTGMIDPSYVYGNLGWQLSFAAFGGVMIMAPLLQAYFFGNKKPGFMRQIIGETLSAQIVTAPLILMTFGQISNVALIANLLILPLVPLAMLLTFITGIVGYVLPWIIHIVAWPVQGLLDYMVYVAETTAHLSWAQSQVNLSLYGVLFAFTLIVAACLYMWRVTQLKLRDANLVE